MRLIIAGSRSITDFSLLIRAIERAGLKNVTQIISGGARGVDTLGECYANLQHIPVRRFEPEQDDNGVYLQNATKMRNQEMAENADALLALWDGKSDGTRDMIERAIEMRLKIYIYQVTE